MYHHRSGEKKQRPKLRGGHIEWGFFKIDSCPYYAKEEQKHIDRKKIYSLSFCADGWLMPYIYSYNHHPPFRDGRVSVSEPLQRTELAI